MSPSFPKRPCSCKTTQGGWRRGLNVPLPSRVAAQLQNNSGRVEKEFECPPPFSSGPTAARQLREGGGDLNVSPSILKRPCSNRTTRGGWRRNLNVPLSLFGLPHSQLGRQRGAFKHAPSLFPSPSHPPQGASWEREGPLNLSSISLP